MHVPPKSSIWKKLFLNNVIPKVNTFCWFLAHQEFLTYENLKEIGIQFPSHLPLHEHKG